MPPLDKNERDFLYEFWIGEGINPNKYWNAYKNGTGYIQKFSQMECYVLEITFETPHKNLPLFNFEPIYKTIKGYYHELKKGILSKDEYNSAGPLFIYEVNRGSVIWTFLGELWYMLVLGTTLSEEKIKGQRLDTLEKKLKILKEYFGEDNVRPELFETFIRADTPFETQEAIQNLFKEKIKMVKISKTSFNGEIEENRRDMIDLKDILLKAENENDI